MSDHRPVSAQFSVETWAIDESAYNEHASSLLMQLGDFEDTDKIPSLKISSAEINFGSVKYMQKVTRKLELRNVGKVSALTAVDPPLQLTRFRSPRVHFVSFHLPKISLLVVTLITLF